MLIMHNDGFDISPGDTGRIHFAFNGQPIPDGTTATVAVYRRSDLDGDALWNHAYPVKDNAFMLELSAADTAMKERVYWWNLILTFENGSVYTATPEPMKMHITDSVDLQGSPDITCRCQSSCGVINAVCVRGEPLYRVNAALIGERGGKGKQGDKGEKGDKGDAGDGNVTFVGQSFIMSIGADGGLDIALERSGSNA